MTPREEYDAAISDAHRAYREAAKLAHWSFDPTVKGRSETEYAQAKQGAYAALKRADQTRHAALVVAARKYNETLETHNDLKWLVGSPTQTAGRPGALEGRMRPAF
jgi:hypothetical protein